VRRIYAEGIATGDATFETEVPDQAVLDAWLPGHRWVAEVDGRVAGWASAKRVSDREVYRGVAETSLYVGDGFRGRGVGKALAHRQVTAADAGRAVDPADHDLPGEPGQHRAAPVGRLPHDRPARAHRPPPRRCGATRSCWSAAGPADHVAGSSSASRSRTRASMSSRIGPDRVDALSGRVVERPVQVALPGEDRAGVAAPHRDHDVGGLDGRGREDLRPLAREVDAELGHGLPDGGVDRVGGRGAGAAHLHRVAAVVAQQRGRHLRAARVVDADEQDGGDGHRKPSGRGTLTPADYLSSIDSMEVERSLERRAAVHHALGDPSRLAIVDALALGEASPTELQALLDLPSNLLAHHVRVLDRAGVVVRTRSEADRRRTYLALVPGVLDALGAVARHDAARVVFVCTAELRTVAARGGAVEPGTGERGRGPGAGDVAGHPPGARRAPRRGRRRPRHRVPLEPVTPRHADDVLDAATSSSPCATPRTRSGRATRTGRSPTPRAAGSRPRSTAPSPISRSGSAASRPPSTRRRHAPS
jgi:DNA-binding transcriptional ArsR family regulator/GNAT superfamily N-acetyltransferase